MIRAIGSALTCGTVPHPTVSGREWKGMEGRRNGKKIIHTPAPARHLSDGAPFARQERANGE